MPCRQFDDRHFCAMALIKDGARRSIFDPSTIILFRELAAARMVRWEPCAVHQVDAWDGGVPGGPTQINFGYATILPDCLSALDDYRELGADV